jgi:hypothetical protein
MVGLGVPVCEPPARFAVHCVPRFRVDTEAASGRGINDTSWRPATASLLARSSPVQLLADLDNFEPHGGLVVEAGRRCLN